jgi:hypothetical protein
LYALAPPGRPVEDDALGNVFSSHLLQTDRLEAELVSFAGPVLRPSALVLDWNGAIAVKLNHVRNAKDPQSVRAKPQGPADPHAWARLILSLGCAAVKQRPLDGEKVVRQLPFDMKEVGLARAIGESLHHREGKPAGGLIH